jgi:PleD family two-component response regulator
MPHKILVVDDREPMRRRIRSLLESAEQVSSDTGNAEMCSPVGNIKFMRHLAIASRY